MLRTGDVRLGLVPVAALLTACSAGTSGPDACVDHSVEEGVDRQAAEAACRAAGED